jgi:hypothetical protein
MRIAAAQTETNSTEQRPGFLGCSPKGTEAQRETEPKSRLNSAALCETLLVLTAEDAEGTEG